MNQKVLYENLDVEVGFCARISQKEFDYLKDKAPPKFLISPGCLYLSITRYNTKYKYMTKSESFSNYNVSIDANYHDYDLPRLNPLELDTERRTEIELRCTVEFRVI
jgi:hypothetical protein